MEDRCVICGEVVPEGTMICPICRDKILPKNKCDPIGRVWTYGYSEPKNKKNRTQNTVCNEKNKSL